jgi:hypothetical protein
MPINYFSGLLGEDFGTESKKSLELKKSDCSLAARALCWADTIHPGIKVRVINISTNKNIIIFIMKQ